MNVSVIDLSANQKKLQVEIPAPRVQEELEHRYRDLAKRVRIKGFRPGKVPRNILKSYYGKSVENEVSSQFIQETFSEALRQADLKPLAQADVDEMRFEDNGTFIYIAIVDVSPPFQVDDYKALEIRRPAAEVGEEQVQAEVERVRDKHARLQTLESDRPIREGDVVVLDLTPSVDGVVFEKGKTNDYMVEVGKKAFHPDLDDQLVGHSAGESFSLELDYPENVPAREIAGKRVHFDVTVKELKERILPELNDEFVQGLGQHETLDGLKEELRSQLQKREDDRAKALVREQITEQMLSKVELELSPRVVEREVDRLIGLLQHQFESQGLKVDPSHFNTPEVRAEYRPQADKNLRWRLICHQIARQEGLDLDEQEMDGIYSDVARVLRTDAAQVRQEYADSSIVEQARENKIQEKVLGLLEEEAVYIETSQEEVTSDQE